MTTNQSPQKTPVRTEITSEYDVATLWRSMAFPRGDRTSLHIHCLDQDIAPDHHNRPSSSRSSQSQVSTPTDRDLCVRLREDLGTLSAFTVGGLLVSWGGLGRKGCASRLMHDALGPLMTNKDLGFKRGRSMSVAVPLMLKILSQPDESEKKIPAHHILVSPHKHAKTRVQRYLINMSVSEDKPVVCLVINGGIKVLQMTLYALKQGSPVILVKGSGGIADAICKILDVVSENEIREQLPSLHKKGQRMLLELHSNFRDTLVVYEPNKAHKKPGEPESKRLDAVILDALLKCGKLKQAGQFLQTMQKGAKGRKVELKDRSESFVEISLVSTLLESMLTHTATACAVIVRNLHIPYETIRFRQLIDLYSKTHEGNQVTSKKRCRISGNYIFNVIFSCESNGGDKKKHSGSVGDIGVERYKQLREDVYKYTKHLMATPLQCPGHKQCDCCKEGFDSTGPTMTDTALIAGGTNVTGETGNKERAANTGGAAHDTTASPTPRSPELAATIRTDRCADGTTFYHADGSMTQQIDGTTTQHADWTTTHRQDPTDDHPDHRCAETCLPPAQELFLWSLFFGDQNLTEAFLEHVEGKIAACLFAFAVFTGMAQKQTNSSQEQMLHQKARHFEDLAARCLRHCHETEVTMTDKLLIKPFERWSKFSPLQIAMVTQSMAFVAEDATKDRLNSIWNGTANSGFVDRLANDLNCRDDCLRILTPVFAFGLGVVFQLLFLLLFSYVLLFDLESSVTPLFIVLSIYVADLAADELRQLLTDSPILRMGCTSNVKQKLRGFTNQRWNFLDVLCILLFVLGMLVFVDHPVAFAFGRVFLCVDALCFFLRFCQTLVYFKNLGIFLVMATKSMKDTGYFMLILLMMTWGYVVATHGVLFPPSNNITSSWSYVLDLPFKGYWQVFDLDLGAISVCQEVTERKVEDGECQKESFLATRYGHYVASVLLALYLMFINVLLMNLLIAKFNNTFKEVHDKAKVYQSWQYSQLVQEYYIHTPAPFSMLGFIITFTTIFCYGIYVFIQKILCSDNYKEPDTGASGDSTEPPSTDPTSNEEIQDNDGDNDNDSDTDDHGLSVHEYDYSDPRQPSMDPTSNEENQDNDGDYDCDSEDYSLSFSEYDYSDYSDSDSTEQPPEEPTNNEENQDSDDDNDNDADDHGPSVPEDDDADSTEQPPEKPTNNEENQDSDDDNTDELDIFESKQMQRALNRAEADRAAGDAVNLANIQRQLDQLRYGLLQVLRTRDS